MTRLLILLLALVAFGGVESAAAQSSSAWDAGGEDPVVLVIHGGAGGPTRGIPAELDARIRAGLEAALRTGYAALAEGGTALDGVTAAIGVLEDDTLFNSGRGAVLAADGTARHDASIMDGGTGQAGASAGTQHVRHPILLARAVMEHSPHVLLTGSGAEEFALRRGLEMMPNSWFVTEHARQDLQRVQQREREEARRAGSSSGDLGTRPEAWQMTGTVGAVAVDRTATLAAGTSTGGMTNKRWDRVGDSPIIGAGTYAANATCGVSATGHGEYFIRLAVAHDIHARMLYLNESVGTAANHVIHETLQATGGQGGVIALDRAGHVAMPFNTPGMARGTITRSGVVRTYLYSDEHPE
ncbi:MAG TPA: isoaspartyl peptidase/L-asparaginase [Rhodothermales bacterium]|nr:isoaspartyl peptidase/L-asparaginase [Rhodothermales bacterium]